MNNKKNLQPNLQTKKYLIIGPAWVGDMVMANSLFQILKQQDPTCAIDVLAPNWTLPLLSRMPEVNRALDINLSHGEFAFFKRYKIAQNLKKNNYTHAIVLPNSWKSALIPWLVGIPIRTGWRGELRYGLLNDVRILDKTKFPKMVQRFIALGYPKDTIENDPIKNISIPYPKLQTNSQSTSETIHSLLKSFPNLKLKEFPILALCPGAEFGTSKRWPEEYYAKIAEEKIKEGWQVWILGSKNDTSVATKIEFTIKNTVTENTIAPSSQLINFAGKTTLSEAIDLLSYATQVLTNDSGLMHIAAALSLPLIALFGSTDPNFTPPLSDKSQIVNLSIGCSPCFKRECPLGHHKCMQDLSWETVLTRI